jgi:hypothetical protein
VASADSVQLGYKTLYAEVIEVATALDVVITIEVDGRSHITTTTVLLKPNHTTTLIIALPTYVHRTDNTKHVFISSESLHVKSEPAKTYVFHDERDSFLYDTPPTTQVVT